MLIKVGKTLNECRAIHLGIAQNGIGPPSPTHYLSGVNVSQFKFRICTDYFGLVAVYFLQFFTKSGLEIWPFKVEVPVRAIFPLYL